MKKADIPKKETEEIYVEAEEDEPRKSKAEPGAKENKDLRNIIIFIVVMALISAAAYLIYLKVFLPLKEPESPEVTESYTYNNFEFKKINNLWTTDIQVGNRIITIWLHNGAREVWPIEILGQINQSFNDGPVYITFDPRDDNKEMIALAAGELAINIVQGVEREVIAACARNETAACYDRPIVTCDSEDKSVIYLLDSNRTWVNFDNNCIIVRGKGSDLLKATDKLILYWYRVVPKEGKVLSESIVENSTS